jgi:hypothetical protein
MVVGIGRSSHVTFLIEVATEMNAVNDLSQCENSDVKLPHWCVVPVVTSDKERVLNVLLDNPFLTRPVLLQKLGNLIEIGDNHNSLASICILSWLANPNLFFIAVFAD